MDERGMEEGSRNRWYSVRSASGWPLCDDDDGLKKERKEGGGVGLVLLARALA